jgi:hypothetical protein
VHVDLCAFRENLNLLRDRLGRTVAGQSPEERSFSCPRVPSAVEPSPMQLLQA